MGDFNAKHWRERIVIRTYGKLALGETNERGEMLLDWMDSDCSDCCEHMLSPQGQGEIHMDLAQWTVQEYD